MMTKTEERLFTERIKRGDHSAFTYVFVQYYADLVLFANTFLRDTSISEEWVQDIFIRLWENRATLSVNSSLKSYLLKAVQNKCIDRIRHLKIKQQYQNDILEHPLLFENDTENYLLYSELQKDMEKALEQLPDEVSHVFRLHRLEGLTYPEIAGKLDVSVRTVEVRISKALLMLKEYLKDYLITLIWFFGIAC